CRRWRPTVGTAENVDWEGLGAFDAYTFTYSDGSAEITLLAGQWRTSEAAAEAFAALGGAESWPGGSGEIPPGPCPDPAEVDDAALYVNQTAVFQVQAPAGGAAEFACRMPM
ncbi:MAG: hypothetical protein LBG11_00680, partial [Bifidobacteriaceae bacterium]|nr:hypothetical protein [Bifidobacteriaceae bacterium]